MLLVGDAQVGEKRPLQIEKAVFLAVVPGGRHFAQLLGFALEQRRLALFAVFELGFVGQ
ncbi:hypothetical protein D3C76_1780390 [compost metagenome]